MQHVRQVIAYVISFLRMLLPSAALVSWVTVMKISGHVGHWLHSKWSLCDVLCGLQCYAENWVNHIQQAEAQQTLQKADRVRHAGDLHVKSIL